jgi:GTPase Era involved in 16S rRNA processing
MGRINVEQYMKKLESVLDEKSTSQRNLRKSSYYVVDTAIYQIMADYIREKYFSYYSNEITE